MTTFGQAVVDWPMSLERLTALKEAWPVDSVPVCTGFSWADRRWVNDHAWAQRQ